MSTLRGVMTGKTGAIQAAGNEEAMAHLAAIVDSSDDAILSKSREGIITSWNHAAETLYGYSAEEAVGRNISFLVPESRRDELREITEKILRGERIRNLQTVRLAKGGREVPVSLTLSPILDSGGNLTGISIIAREDAERAQMERLLRESERYYRTLVEMAPDPVLVHRGGDFLYANCAALGVFGAQDLHTLRSHTLYELIHPDDREAMEHKIVAMKDGEEIPLLEFRIRRLDGEVRFMEGSSTVIVYRGSPAVQTIARDVSERKAAQAEHEAMLRELAFQQSRFELVVEQLPVGVVVAEASSGKVVYQNDIIRDIFRVQPEETTTVSDFDSWKLYRLDGSHVSAPDIPLSRAISEGETVLGEEYQVLRGDGSRGFVSINATPLRDMSGSIISGLATFTDVTESRVAAKALAESEERLKLALDAAEMGACDIDVATGEGNWSRRHFLLMGYPAPDRDPAPASLSMWQDLIHAEDRERVLSALDEACHQNQLFSSEHRIIRADKGDAVWVNVIGRFVCEPAGSSCRFIGVIFDVTRRKATEEELLRSTRRLRNLADSMPQIVWTAGPDGTIDYLNAHFHSYTGIGPDFLNECGGSPSGLIACCIHPDDRQRTAELWGEAIATGTTYQNEQRILGADGSYRWHLSRATAERDEHGKVAKWYGTSTDIHELRGVQERLRSSETKFRWLYESNLIAIFFWNRDGRITDANDAYCDLIGHTGIECRSGDLNLADVTAPEDRAKDRSAMDEIISRGISKTYEKVFVRSRNGRRVAALTALARMADTDEEGIGFAVDLTELKRAEQALKDNEATLKLAVETTGLGIFSMDLATGSGEWSVIARQHYGLPKDAETDLATVLRCVHPEDRGRLEQIVKDARTPAGAGLYSAEYRTVGSVDGKVRWISMRARVSYSEDGTPLRLVGACMNISDIVMSQEALREEMTERLRAVEELRRQEQLLIRQGRLAAMGEMIANIAHQWRQPLNTLGLIVQELPTYYNQGLFNEDYLDTSVARAMKVINYMSQTIDGFRNFFGPDKEKQRFRALDVLEQTLTILQGAFAAAKLEIDLQADPDAWVVGIPNEFAQVLLNILMNAKDALVERKIERPRVEVRLKVAEGKTVITIEDNAGGIPQEIIEKVFDPYFTTKGPDKGTGIGLFMSKTIVEKNMNGALTVTNTGEGACFRIEV